MVSDARPQGHYDLAIVGGGMVGGLLAAALADSGLRLLVLDAAAAPVMPEGPAGVRVSAITEASHWMLRNTGAWACLPPERLCAYASMKVWDADGTGRVAFDAAMVPADQLGWIVENDALAAALYTRCGDRGVNWYCGERIADLEPVQEGWQVRLADGSALTAGLLVGADGARSMVRSRAGIPALPRDSGHVAVVAALQTERPHGRCARQRFIDSGPLALLPLFGDGHQCSLVWSMPPSQAEACRLMTDDSFAVALTEASEGVLGFCKQIGPRAAFPIRTLHANHYIGRHLVLVGDAAHVVHPLAGQGVNLGLLDAGVLAEEIRRALAAGLPIHHESVLRRYQRRRRAHNALMINAFNGVKAFFAQRDPAIRFLRNVGMNLVDRVTPAKQFFAREALGRNGDMPALARPVRP